MTVGSSRLQIILCSVCKESVEPHTEAVCNACGETYHLNQRADVPGKDCGQVWINEEHLALEFACNTCLEPPAPLSALDEVVDLAEAAAATGIPEAALRHAAATGELPSRTLAGSILIFQRSDLAVFAEGRK